jgi:hypothetical protein
MAQQIDRYSPREAGDCYQGQCIRERAGEHAIGSTWILFMNRMIIPAGAAMSTKRKQDSRFAVASILYYSTKEAGRCGWLELRQLQIRSGHRREKDALLLLTDLHGELPSPFEVPAAEFCDVQNEHHARQGYRNVGCICWSSHSWTGPVVVVSMALETTNPRRTISTIFASLASVSAQGSGSRR